MKIQQEELNNEGSFFIKEDEQQLALMTYRMAADNILEILHTEVDERLQGKNVGSNLVTAAANYARENNLRIRSLCSFAGAVLNKKKDVFADVLDQVN